jgi:hypothetical protein
MRSLAGPDADFFDRTTSSRASPLMSPTAGARCKIGNRLRLVRQTQAARAAGISAIGMLSGGFAKDELTATGCGVVFHNPADMLRHITELSVCRMACSDLYDDVCDAPSSFAASTTTYHPHGTKISVATFVRAREVNWRHRCLVPPRSRRSIRRNRSLICAISMPL